MAADELFIIETPKVSRELLPSNKRSFSMRAWMISLLKPVQDLLGENFDVFRPLKLQETKYNSQKIVLEQIINDQVGVTGAPFAFITTNPRDTNGAFITNGDTDAFAIVDNELFASDFIGDNYTVGGTTNFTVSIPLQAFNMLTQDDLDALDATIDKFKIAPMTHDVVSF